MKPVTLISGINNMSIFYYQNKKFYFFGDLHEQNQHSCDQEYACDYFNYDFSHVETHGSSCTTIGPLLFYWFNYNNANGIHTDFLFEESYTKKNERQYYQYFKQIVDIRKSQHVNVLSTIFPRKDMSWLALTGALLQPCLYKNKDKCKYQYVHMHNVDIRALEGEKVSPFSLIFLEEELQSFYPPDIKDELIFIVKTLLYRYRDIIKALVDDYDDDLKTIYDDLFKSLYYLKPIYQQQVNLMKQMYINNTHIIATELKKLNSGIRHNIINFILHLSDDYIKPIIDQFDQWINKWFYYFDNETPDEQLNTLTLLLTTYMNHFTVLAAYTMDIYVLCKLFLAEGDDVIVYTGAYHIEVYNLFFKQLTEPIFESKTYEHRKCIQFDQLPKYLNVNQFREFYYII
ncbi:MAG TPA: hypothetical protein VLG50_08095 [Candidatus Saccharimonadales bacterium]|nr:hypothetical protein [Candidatus Saccharimonadales bacterium]